MFKSSTLTWWQMGLFKASLLAIGVAIGSNWSEIFLPYTVWLVGVGLVLGLYIAIVWFRE
ncbi:MAG: hypothetical protein KBD06_01785 [Candidatus Pacebacteria bacterium]|nr:hypothetical protein [Candidatus Paceibacterota bacterium]